MFVDKDQPFLSVEREVIIFIIRQVNKMTEIVCLYMKPNLIGKSIRNSQGISRCYWKDRPQDRRIHST